MQLRPKIVVLENFSPTILKWSWRFLRVFFGIFTWIFVDFAWAFSFFELFEFFSKCPKKPCYKTLILLIGFSPGLKEGLLFPLQYKSCCIRRHAGLFSKTCLDFKTCHTIYSKTRLKYRTQQPSVDVTMTSSLISGFFKSRWNYLFWPPFFIGLN